MTPYQSPSPGDSRPLAEELLLLCAEPTRGLLRIPGTTFPTAITGAVLAELQLRGALTVEGRRITGFHPLGDHDELAARVLAELERAGKNRHRATLDHVLRRVPHRTGPQYYLDRLTGQGVLTVRTHRFLGLPYRRWTAVPPDAGALIAERVAATLARTAVSGPTSPAEERDHQLAGLIGAVRLEYRIYRGTAGTPTRRAVRRLSRSLPVAHAVKQAVARRTAAASG
ncbi:GPP34 family phosphoprotein [Kitasatospora aureofaciens]|uniref:GOLPH3/VPS74 family protein n=1 Tax=Kitasatospora aureofaciens TaxID=1894 RepID=UPI00068937F4|nr:GPP34 family phosphoprotein [Kitasatospora aureofaciens]HJD81269.1 GPP34 family phosphoprotein [Kitasatospora aureofaciens]